MYVIHPWYNKGNSNPLGVIQIPWLGLTLEITNYGKITTGDSLVWLRTTESAQNKPTRQGRWEKVPNSLKSCKCGTRITEDELIDAHWSITQHRLGWTDGGTPKTQCGFLNYKD